LRAFEGGVTVPGGKDLYKELTGETLANRKLVNQSGATIANTTPIYLIVDKNSAIVAGWYMSKDCECVVTWGIKQKDQITWHNTSTYNLNNDNSPENGNVCSADIDPSVGYITYMRESSDSKMYR
jgi:hypothetical protein